MSLSPFKRRLVAAAWTEYVLWTNMATGGRYHETNPAVTSRMRAYWDTIGKSYTDAQFQSAATYNWMFWSAVFISYLFKTAGAGSHFAYAMNHAKYVHAAKDNAGKDTTQYPFQAFPHNAFPPEVGDVLCNWFGSKTEYKDIDPNNYQHFPSHCDLVVEVTDKNVTVIGGNVGATAGSQNGVTVNKRTRTRDAAGFVNLNNGVAIIKNYL